MKKHINTKNLKSLFNRNETKIAVSLVIIIVVSVLFFGEKQTEYETNRTIRYSFTLQNKTNQVLKNIDFWVYAPVEETSNQKVESITASHDYQMTKDKLGNQVLHFKIKQFSPFASKIIKLESKLLLSSKPRTKKLLHKELFLKSEKYVEVESPDIKAVANQFKGSNSLKKAKATMDWVHQNIKYAGYIEDDRGALYALKARKGDCTEYMYLYTALMRNQGIPVRNMGGYVYSENKVLKAEDFHNWSEIYLNGKWQVVDPQNGKFLENQNNYLAFRVISSNIKQDLTPSNTQRFAISHPNISAKIN